jgi:hypothetical protein
MVRRATQLDNFVGIAGFPEADREAVSQQTGSGSNRFDGIMVAITKAG